METTAKEKECNQETPQMEVPLKEEHPLSEVNSSLSPSLPLSAPNVRMGEGGQSSFNLKDMSAALHLPKATIMKKKPVDEWEVERPLKATHFEALYQINEKVLASSSTHEGQREARITKFNTKSIKRVRIMLYRVHFRGTTSKLDEWLEEPALEKYCELKATAIREKAALEFETQQAEKKAKKTRTPKPKKSSLSSEGEGPDANVDELSPMKTQAHPPYGDMVKLAISELKERKGSSQSAIVKYIQRNFFVSESKSKKAISVALKQNIKLGAVLRVKASYKLSKAAIKQMVILKAKAKKTELSASTTTRVSRPSKRRFPMEDELLDEAMLAVGRPPVGLPDPQPTSFSFMPYSSSDLIMIWDFFRLYRHHISTKTPEFTIDELQDALLETNTCTSNSLITSLCLTLLRALCCRRSNGAPVSEEDAPPMDYSLPPARVLWGHFINVITWPEIVRRFVLATDQFTRKANEMVLRQFKSNSGANQQRPPLMVSLLEGDGALKAAVDKLGGVGGPVDNVCCVALLRFLVNESLALPQIGAKINEDGAQLQGARLELKKAVYEERKAIARMEGKPLHLGKRKANHNTEDKEPEVELSTKEAAGLVASTAQRSAKTELKYPVRREKLGEDRLRRQYWYFHGLNKLFVRSVEKMENCVDENEIKEHWSAITKIEELEQLRDALDERGIREKALKATLSKEWSVLTANLDKKAKQAAPHPELVVSEEPRRSSRIKDVTETQMLEEEVEVVKTTTATTLTSSSIYRPLDEPWQLLSLDEPLSDDIGCCRQDLVALGNKLSRLCPDALDASCPTWRRDLKQVSTSFREFIPTALALEATLYQAEHPSDDGNEDFMLSIATSVSDDEEDEEEDESPNGIVGNSPSSEQEPHRGMGKQSLSLCKDVLNSIRSRAQAGWFTDPVDAVALGIPHYHDIVKIPMDFGTISLKLAKGDYDSHEEFASDMELVFSNAVMFTPEPEATVHKAAVTLQSLFLTKYNALAAKLKTAEIDHSVASVEDTNSEEAENENNEVLSETGAPDELKDDARMPNDDVGVDEREGELGASVNNSEVEPAHEDGAEESACEEETDSNDDDEVSGMNDDEVESQNNQEDLEEEEEVDSEGDENNNDEENMNEDNAVEEAEAEEVGVSDGAKDSMKTSEEEELDQHSEFESLLAEEVAMFQGVASKDSSARLVWRQGIEEANTPAAYALFQFALLDMARQLLPRMEEQVAAAMSLFSLRSPTPLIAVRISSRGASGVSSLVWGKVNGQWWPSRLRIASEVRYQNVLSKRGEVLVTPIGEPLLPFVVALDDTAPFLGSEVDPHMPRPGRPARRALNQAIKVGKALRKHFETH